MDLSGKQTPRFHSSVCRADEPSPRGAGRAGCHGLQVRADRGKAAILLPGGPTVLCDQAAHQLSLQGDRDHTRQTLHVLKFGLAEDATEHHSPTVLVHVKTVHMILSKSGLLSDSYTLPWPLPGARASVPEAVVVAAVLFSAHQTARTSLESAASHGASDLRGRRNCRGAPAHQDWLCSPRAGQRMQIHTL